jgi:ATP-dependent 26S proteasome regulatory subunit
MEVTESSEPIVILIIIENSILEVLKCLSLKQVDELRGSPMSVGNLEEIIDDNHAIVSTRY